MLLGLIVPVSMFAAGTWEGEKPVKEEDVLEMVRKEVAAGSGKAIEMMAETCGTCHGAETKYPVAGAQLAYSQSGHLLGFGKHAQNSWYANGNGCQECHTNEGFIEKVNTGKVEGFVSNPSQIGCFTCHEPHMKGDFSVRTAAPVKINAGVTFNKGDANLCANCHQARREVTSSVVAGSLSSHFGAHHGPHADMFLGVNGFEVPGKSYSTSAHTMVIQNACIDCHMATPEGRYSLSPEIGGHSFYVKGEVHEAEKLNVAGCISCHEGIGQTVEFFNITAKADYDGDGEIEVAQAEVEGLLLRIVNDEGTGVLQTANPPAYKADGSWNSTRGLEFPIETVAAVWNYKFIEEDRSHGVHNMVYTVQLLMDTVGAFDPSFDTSSRP